MYYLGVHVQSDFRSTNQCFVGGWGAFFSGGPAAFNLQSVNVNVYSDEYCRENIGILLNQAFTGNGLEFCAGFIEGGKDSC